MKKILLSIFASAIMSGQAAQAVTLNAVDTGVFARSQTVGGLGSRTGYNHTSSDTALNYTFSINGGSSTFDDNAFAIFDLSGVTGTVTSASIEMSLSTNNLLSGVPGSFVFNQVSSDPALFNSSYFESSNCFGVPSCSPIGTGADLYFDIGDGPALGTVSYAGIGSQTAVLGTAGLDLINLGQGGFLVIGINSASGNGFGDLTFATPQLTFEVAAVPVPGAVWLFGSGLVGLVGLARRKTLA